MTLQDLLHYGEGAVLGALLIGHQFGLFFLCLAIIIVFELLHHVHRVKDKNKKNTVDIINKG